MTLPVLHTRHSLALAARRMLAGLPACLAHLGPSTGRTAANTWLFVDTLQVVVEGTQSCACVVRVDGAWGRPNVHNTAAFPRLSIEIYADPTRSPAVVGDAEARARRAFEPFRAALHRTSGFSEVWGRTPADPGLRVWGAQLLAEPEVFDIADYVGGKRLQGHFGLNVG